ncbi:hypothetical protein A3Q34_19085 [Colwellia sp. PAMC 20917]|jgi:hypothetical protein|uniref:hypothetical protein n=1 Tax=unclassified Colwellia TaxID=196834 RepID=UPI000878E5A9|nr:MULTISPECIES: hypothetical protein [unclassified Colwellia]AOW78757.1 hypothetical protein A3Q34_19085 [Colwellia sp. PAMC 20917]MBA6251854.1 hypothetical protein [Colwellia sp. MB3u-55]MBA6398401.1 hypothetical protein [Colwellia sp. BRX10-4]
MRIRPLLSILCFLFLSYPAYLWLTYIDETVTSGSAYGLKIGANKNNVYKSLARSLSQFKGDGDSVFIQIKVTTETAKDLATKPDFNVMVEPLFHPIGFSSFEKQDTWSFYVNASYFNSLKLKFCEEKLCEIHRHRKYFELP